MIVVLALFLGQPPAKASLIKQDKSQLSLLGRVLPCSSSWQMSRGPQQPASLGTAPWLQARGNGLLAEDTSPAPRSPTATSCGVFLRGQPRNGLPIVTQGHHSGYPGQETSGWGLSVGQVHLGAPALRVSPDHGGSRSRKVCLCRLPGSMRDVPAFICPLLPTANRRGQGGARVRVG